MDIGFETVGNATLIIHDKSPVLTTDPWVSGSAFFGAWSLSHEIPAEQLASIRACKWHWYSHGHPDHLHFESFDSLKQKTILLPDHIGGRIANDLRARGRQVEVLPDRRWVELSPRVRVMCFADYNQDAVLLIDVNGRLIVNMNDAVDHGWMARIRKIVAQYAISFCLALSTLYDELDMINIFDETNERLPIIRNAASLGARNAWATENIGATHYIPFSSLHRYQRADCMWAQKYRPALEDHQNGFVSSRCTILPAYVRYDAFTDQWEALKPAEQKHIVYPPEDFGDSWTDVLEEEDVRDATTYFSSIHHLGQCFDFIRLNVGGREHVITLSPGGFARGITLSAPRHSLMCAIRNEIFDDVLIGNFTRVTLHGDWGPGKLYPDFTPYIAKYADNGRARTADEIKRYLLAYQRRAPVDFLRFHARKNDENPWKRYVRQHSLRLRLSEKLLRFLP